MAASYRSKSTGNATGTLVLSKPSGTVDGDVMVAVVRLGYPSETFSAVPSGWTQLYNSTVGGYRQGVWYKVAASEGASYSWTGSGGSYVAGYIATFTGNATSSPISNFTSATDSTLNTAAVTPSIVPSNSGLALAVFSQSTGNSANVASSVDNSFTLRHDGTGSENYLATKAAVATVATGATTFTTASAQIFDSPGFQMVVRDLNTAPNAPTLTNPIGSAVIDLTASNVFTWTFSDPDTGDTQSAYELRYRIVGAGSWTTTGMVTSAVSSRTIAASTFAAGDYEWQVLTYDAIGAVGPFSSSSFFTAASPPATPTITSPSSGATISSSTSSIVWSTPNQTSYQVRKVADSAGSPDTATVYYDSGEVVDSAARTASLTFPTNSRFEHLQVRVKYSGLWSSWASVRVQVSYTAPATPTAVVTSNSPTGAVTIAATHPTPTGSQPTVTGFDLYRRTVGDTSTGIRVAANVAPTSSFVDWSVASGTAYEYRALDLGNNNTSTYSAWTG